VVGAPGKSRINSALKQVQQRLNATKAAVTSVRRARMSDSTAIFELVNYWANKGEILPRSQDNIIHDIQNFVVASVGGKVVGCASLYIYEKCLAEIRSIVVEEDTHQQGQGVALVQYLLEFAHQMELKDIIVLTYIPTYFEKLGFGIIEKSSLADNIIEDSEPTELKDPNSEVAMKYTLGQV
jgi:argininosuccinate lyase/amino-acid N-acetyltransferase